MNDDTIRGDRKLATAADGRHRSAVMDWIGSGCPHTICQDDNKTRIYQLPEVIEWCANRGIDFYNKKNPANGGSKSTPELDAKYNEQLLRKLKLQCKKLELDKQIREGKYIHVDSWMPKYERGLQEMKSHIIECFESLKSFNRKMTAAEELEIDKIITAGFNRMAEGEFE